MNSARHPSTRFPTSMRATAFSLLWLALVLQISWMLLQHLHRHQSWGSMWYPLTFTISLLLFAISHGRVVWITLMQRLLIAAAFLQAVADRLGLLGPPGTSGVEWGDFTHFIHYTAQVNSFMPVSIIPALAALATIAEVLFGLPLLLGIWTSAAAAGSCILLAVFATAMTVSGLSQFSYSVYLMAAGALALATVDGSRLSVDSLLRQRTRSRQ